MIHKRILLVGVILAVALSLPFYGRSWNLFMHQLGSILFVGNIMVSAVWMSLARRSGGAEALRLGVRGVMVTDALFTTPGALLLLLNGGILGTEFFRAGATWLFVSIALFLLSFILWVVVLLPAQRGLWREVERVPADGSVPAGWEPLYKRWFRAGGITTLLILVTLVLMVFKPAL